MKVSSQHVEHIKLKIQKARTRYCRFVELEEVSEIGQDRAKGEFHIIWIANDGGDE